MQQAAVEASLAELAGQEKEAQTREELMASREQDSVLVRSENFLI